MNGGTATIILDRDRIVMSGQLNFTTVAGVWNDSLSLLDRNEKIIIDLSQVVSADSSALALLIEWLKYAEKKHKTILFQNVPAQLQSIARVAGVQHLWT